MFETFLDTNAPELRSFPIQRNTNGAAFKTSAGREYTGLIMFPGVNWTDGLHWFPTDTDLKEERSGGFGFPHTSAMKVGSGGVVTVGEVTEKLISIGLMYNDKYMPIWYPEKPYVVDNKLIQQVGPIKRVVEFSEIGMKEVLTLYEMPPLTIGALAIEYDCEGLPPPDS